MPHNKTARNLLYGVTAPPLTFQPAPWATIKSLLRSNAVQLKIPGTRIRCTIARGGPRWTQNSTVISPVSWYYNDRWTFSAETYIVPHDNTGIGLSLFPEVSSAGGSAFDGCSLICCHAGASAMFRNQQSVERNATQCQS